MKLVPGRLASKSHGQRLREVRAFLKRVQVHDRASLTLVTGKAFPSPVYSRTVSLRLASLFVIVGGALTVFAAGSGFQTSRSEFSADGQVSSALNVSSTGGENQAAIGLVREAAALSAQRLLDSGHTIEARRLLSRRDVAATEAGSWRLARSYDPNYLASIPSSDALPDKALASEWYRRWRDISARHGLEMDDLRLKRLIGSMR